MNRLLWDKAIWHFSRWIKSIGMPGVMLLLLASGGYMGMVQPQQARIVQLQQDLVDEQMRQQTELLHPEVDTRSTEARLQQFYEFFPAQQQAPILLKAIYRAARDESISLAEGEYKLSNTKVGGIAMYKVDLPVKGSYVQIRKFIVKILNALPTAALDEVSFKREVVGSGELEAKVRFTIYLGVK